MEQRCILTCTQPQAHAPQSGAESFNRHALALGPGHTHTSAYYYMIRECVEKKRNYLFN